MTTGAVRRSALAVLGCGVVAVVAAAVPPTGGYTYAAHDRSLYDVSTVFQLALLLVAGATLLFRDRATQRVGGALGIVAGGQLAGTGVVAWRRWHTSAGFGSPASNEHTLRSLAVLLAIAGGAAVVLCLVVLRREGLFHRLGRRRGLAIVGVTAASALAIAVPLSMGHEYGARMTQLAAHALMYGLPWAFAMLIGTLADRITAVTAVLAVVSSAVPLLGEILMIPAARPAMGFVVAAAVGAIVTAFAVAAPQRPERRVRTLPVRVDPRRPQRR